MKWQPQLIIVQLTISILPYIVEISISEIGELRKGGV